MAKNHAIIMAPSAPRWRWRYMRSSLKWRLRAPFFMGAMGVFTYNLGKVEAVEFVSYEAILERFQQEWPEIVRRAQGKKK